MKKLTAGLLAIAMVLLTGCLVTSVYPFYNDKDVRFEPALVGTWTNITQADEHWSFARSGTNMYQLAYSSEGKTAVMESRFFKLQEESFLDLFTTELKDDVEPPPIPSHFLLRVLQTSPTLKMAPLNYDWLVETLAKKPKALRHHIIAMGNKPEDQRLVLTADTPELQSFVIKNLKTEDAWKAPFELKKVP